MITCPKCSENQPDGEICRSCGLVFRKYRPPRPRRPAEEPYDWERFWIHFICGALAGAGMGTLIWIRFWHQGPSAWLVIGVSSLLSAVMAGVFGDIWWWQMINAWRSRRWWW